MWHCLSCYFCTVRCPRGVKPTDLFHILEGLANKHGFKPKGTRTPAMYRSFVDSIKRNGRVHEFRFLFKYYLSTNPFVALKMLPAGVQLFSHKRLPLTAKKVKGSGDLAKIIKKLRQVRGD